MDKEKDKKIIEIWQKEMPEGAYELLDCGEGEKLEKVGRETIIRAEPRAWWKKSLNKEEWDKAESIYKMNGQKGKWVFKNEEEKKDFDLNIGDIKAKIKFAGSSKHIGLFPEQYSEWIFIEKKIKEEIENKNREVNVLNLFGYTGLASLFATKAGAKVTHVDASEVSLEWARENQKLSGLGELPIRWILDDVLKFIKREIKRGTKYDVIIMDPPSFGRGPKGEIWKMEENVEELIDSCGELLS